MVRYVRAKRDLTSNSVTSWRVYRSRYDDSGELLFDRFIDDFDFEDTAIDFAKSIATPKNPCRVVMQYYDGDYYDEVVWSSI